MKLSELKTLEQLIEEHKKDPEFCIEWIRQMNRYVVSPDREHCSPLLELNGYDDLEEAKTLAVDLGWKVYEKAGDDWKFVF